jgi:dephospho-CoA kinase
MAAHVRIFGLTGGIASGKSSVAGYFQDLGARTIDADRLGHSLIQPSLPAYQEIVALFGKEILDASGAIDRTRLGAVVFRDPKRLRELNAILHPRILEKSNEMAAEFLAQNPGSLVIVEAALIYEARFEDRFSKIIVTWCRPEQQLQRLLAKGLTREDAERRIAAQMPMEEKRQRADYVVDCSGSKEDARRQVEALFPQLKR